MFNKLIFLVFGLVLTALPALAQNADVRVVHGIDGRDPGATQELPVDVSVDGNCTLQGFKFGEVAGPLSLPAGTYNVKISLSNTAMPCANAAVVDANVPIGAGENVIIIAHLDENGMPMASKFVNDVSEPGFLSSRAILQHTAAAPTVDIIARRAFVGSGFAAIRGVSNGQQADYNTFFGFFEVTVAAAGTDLAVLTGLPLLLLPGDIVSVFVVGSFANGTLSTIAVPLN